jgi:cardiolipin synthase
MTNFISGNQIKLLRNGAEYFPALEAAIETAEHEIYLETYIYQADKTGIKIGQALLRAAQRGVSVCLLLDGFGSQDLSRSYIQSLGLGGVQVTFYRSKISPWTFKKNRLRRLHRKIVVIDQKVGFVGGINIIDDDDVPTGATSRVDYAVRIEGALLPMLYASVHKLWRRIARSQLRPLKKSVTTFSSAHYSNHDGMKASLVLRDNIMHRRDIEVAYLSAIQHAKTEIIIANAYFLPGGKLRRALIDAARRGAKGRLEKEPGLG